MLSRYCADRCDKECVHPARQGKHMTRDRVTPRNAGTTLTPLRLTTRHLPVPPRPRVDHACTLHASTPPSHGLPRAPSPWRTAMRHQKRWPWNPRGSRARLTKYTTATSCRATLRCHLGQLRYPIPTARLVDTALSSLAGPPSPRAGMKPPWVSKDTWHTECIPTTYIHSI